MQETKEEQHFAVLSTKSGGGPHGLGDPADKSLRRVEREIMIPRIIRDKARQEKCIPEVAAFSECCKENGLSMVLKCRAETETMKDCLSSWYNNEEFIKECTQIYLAQRTEYRTTGITQKQKRKDIIL